jgi:hypothetical protein
VIVNPDSFETFDHEALIDFDAPPVADNVNEPGALRFTLLTVIAMVVVVVKASPDVPEFSVAVTVYVPLSAVVAEDETVTTPVELFIDIALRPKLFIE